MKQQKKKKIWNKNEKQNKKKNKKKLATRTLKIAIYIL